MICNRSQTQDKGNTCTCIFVSHFHLLLNDLFTYQACLLKKTLKDTMPVIAQLPMTRNTYVDEKLVLK